MFQFGRLGIVRGANPTKALPWRQDWATHLPCQGLICEVIRQKFPTGIFKTEFMSFLDKNKKWTLSHFWSSHS